MAKSEILGHFSRSRKRVFTGDQVFAELQANRAAWRVPQRVTGAKFIRFLQEEGVFREVPIRFDRLEKSFVRYACPDASPLEIALSLNRKSFLCHSSAAFVLGLSDVVPRRIYFNVEQTPKPLPRSALTQEGIDAAFRRPQRQSNQLYEFEDYSAVMISGKHSGHFEVGEVAFLDPVFSSTLLERTLVDLAVRPACGGGVSQVLEAYRRARETASTMKLLAVLRKLNYSYPYHQAVGFYMQRAGFRPEQYSRFQAAGLLFDFYLAHNMGPTDYDSAWRIKS